MQAEGKGKPIVNIPYRTEYFDSKYGFPDSYCNTFYEMLSENEILLLYNDLTYPDENGVPTKAAFVRKISLTE